MVLKDGKWPFAYVNNFRFNKWHFHVDFADAYGYLGTRSVHSDMDSLLL